MSRTNTETAENTGDMASPTGSNRKTVTLTHKDGRTVTCLPIESSINHYAAQGFKKGK